MAVKINATEKTAGGGTAGFGGIPSISSPGGNAISTGVSRTDPTGSVSTNRTGNASAGSVSLPKLSLPAKPGTDYSDSPPSNGQSGGNSGGVYSGGGDYSGYSGYSFIGGGSGTPAAPWTDGIVSDPDSLKNLYNADAAKEASTELLKGAGLDAGPAEVGRVEHVDTVQEEQMLKQINEAAQKQAELQVNNSVQQGTTDLQRNMQNAQEQYQTARDQIDIDEARALDNQALYAEARGDRGGIGQAQYDTVQNTAATNRLTVQNEQTRLATDTARQITDLRAQGEFEKANQLLGITQNYLSQLMNLYTWAKETNVGIDEFNIQVEEWEENYKLSLLGANIDIANATGVFANGTPTYNTWANTQKLLAASGQALLEKGIAPTSEQLAAMGMTKTQAEGLANASSGSRSGGYRLTSYIGK